MYRQALFKLANPMGAAPPAPAKRKKRKSIAGLELDPLNISAAAAVPLGLAAYSAGDTMFSDRDLSRVRNFRDTLERMHVEAADPRQAIIDYAESGGPAADIRMSGAPLVDVLKTLRSTPGLPENLKWKPNSGEHYQEFAKGPVSGYLQRLREYQYDRGMNVKGTNQQWTTGGAGLPMLNKAINEGGWDMKREYLEQPGTKDYLSWMGSYKPDTPQAHKNRDALFKLIQDIKPAAGTVAKPLPANYDNMTEDLEKAYAAFSKANKLPELAYQPPEMQSGKLKDFDSYVKQTDPDLWRGKQLVDYTAGVGTAQGATKFYGKRLLTPALSLRKGLMIGGGVLAAGAAGYLLYQLLKKKPEAKTASEGEAESEKERKRKLMYGAAYAGGLGIAGASLLSMNSSDLRRLQAFQAGADKWSTTSNPRKDIRDYAVHGSEAMNTKFMGVGADSVIKSIKKHNPFSSKPYDAWQDRHYDNFKQNPLSAYLVRVKEWDEQPTDNADSASMPRTQALRQPVDRFGADKLKNLSVAMASLPKSVADASHPESYYQSYADLVADTGGPPTTVTGLHGKLQSAFNNYINEKGINQSQLSSEGYRKLLDDVDASLKTTDPDLWKAKQWQDFDMGRASTHAAQGYKKTIAPFVWLRKYGPAIGAATAAVGAAGLLYYALRSSATKKKRTSPAASPELKIAEDSNDKWKSAMKWLLIGGATAGAGYGAYKLLTSKAAPVTPAAPTSNPAVPAPAAPAQAPATASVVTPAAPKLDTKLTQFKQHWDSMPEWRRARALSSLQSELGDPASFKELSWWSRKKLELLTGKTYDKYGPGYGPVAQFVLDNKDPELIRQAYTIAQSNPGKDY